MDYLCPMVLQKVWHGDLDFWSRRRAVAHRLRRACLGARRLDPGASRHGLAGGHRTQEQRGEPWNAALMR